MPTHDRPAGEHQIPIRSFTDLHVRLENRVAAKVAGEQSRLVIEVAAANEAIDFLKADQVGISDSIVSMIRASE